MNFEISHRTIYRYSAPVSQSHHLLHLTPRSHTRQTVLRHSLIIDPAPASKTEVTDDFGNPASIITIEQDHTKLEIHSRAQVEVQAPMPVEPDAAEAGTTSPPSFARTSVRKPSTLSSTPAPRDTSGLRATFTGSRARASPTAGPFSRRCRISRRGFIESSNIKPGSTDAATSVEEVLRIKRGVCQDFAHLEIACCARSASPPAM